MTQRNSKELFGEQSAASKLISFPQFRSSVVPGAPLVHASTQAEFYERIVQEMIRSDVQPHYPYFEEA